MSMKYWSNGVETPGVEFEACVPALCCFFFSSRRRHTRLQGDWSSDVCSSDLKLTVRQRDAVLLGRLAQHGEGVVADLVAEAARAGVDHDAHHVLLQAHGLGGILDRKSVV